MVHNNDDNKFIKIPNYIVYIYEKNSMYKKLGGKTMMELSKDNKYLINVIVNLGYNVNRRGECTFTIKSLMEDIELKEDKNNIAVNKIKAVIKLLYSFGIIYNVNVDLSKVKPTDYIRCKLREDYEEEYLQLYYNDYEFIKSLDLDIEEKIGMLNLYCYILAKYRENYIVNPNDYTHFTIEDVIKHLNISKNTVLKAKSNLLKHNMIKSNSIGKIKSTKHNCSDVYAFTDEGLKMGLINSKEYYESKYGKNGIIYKIKKIDLKV